MGKRKCRVTLVVLVAHDNKVTFYRRCVGNPLNYIYLPDINMKEAPLVVISVRIIHMSYNYKWQFPIKSWLSLWYAKDFEL
jgi:hypothetical protein